MTKGKNHRGQRLQLSAPAAAPGIRANPSVSEPRPKPSQFEPNGPVYFWRENRENGYLCQWDNTPFEVDGVLYYTAEHWMMAGKARLFNDDETLQKILRSPNPGKVKTLGRQVKNFDVEIWLQNCDNVVEEGNMYKFQSNEGLKKKLLGTGERELVEASPHDRVWGIGFREEEAERNRSDWGENRLGKVLMRVRKRFREEDEVAAVQKQEDSPPSA